MSADPALDAALLEEFLGAVVILTPQGEVLSWNHGAETLSGFPAAAALHRSVFDLVIPAGQTEETRGKLAGRAGAAAAGTGTPRRASCRPPD